MPGKSLVIAFWGGALVIVHGFVSGDIQELIALTLAQQTTVTNPGFGLRLLGESAIVVVLVMLSEISDQAGNLGIAFLAALTLLFLVKNNASLSTWLTQVENPNFGGGSGGTFGGGAPLRGKHG